jgi:hypothetical protein
MEVVKMIYGDPTTPTIDSLHSRLSRLILDTSSDGFWTAAMRNQYLNEAYTEINAELKPIRGYKSFATSPETGGYTLPTDFMEFAPGGVTFAFDNNVNTVYRLARLGISELDQAFTGWQTTGYQSGTPQAYLFDLSIPTQASISLVPKPTTSGTFRIEYHPTVAPLVTSTSVPWGGAFSSYHRVIATVAAEKARIEEENLQAAQVLHQMALIDMLEFKKAIARVGEQRYRLLTPGGYRGVNGFGQ